MSAPQQNIGNQGHQLPGSFPSNNQAAGGPTIGTHGGPGTGISGLGQHTINTQNPANGAQGMTHGGVGQGGPTNALPGQHGVGNDQHHGLHGSGGQHAHGVPQGAQQFGNNTQPGTQPPVSSLVDEALGNRTHHIPQEVSQSIQAGRGGVPSPVHGHHDGSQQQQQLQNRQGGIGGAGIAGQQNIGQGQQHQPSFISRSEILHQLRNPSPRGDYYLLVDVRRNDWLGGTINGSLNIPADSLEKSTPTLYELVRRIPLAERDPDASVVVVFYCGSCSPGRGGRAAAEFQRFLDSRGERRVKACALEGGVKGWAGAGPMYTKFMDNYDENHWRNHGSGGITGGHHQGGLTGHGSHQGGLTGHGNHQGGLTGHGTHHDGLGGHQGGVAGQQGGISGPQGGMGGVNSGQHHTGLTGGHHQGGIAGPQGGMGGANNGQHHTGLTGSHHQGGLPGQQGGLAGQHGGMGHQQQQPAMGGMAGQHTTGGLTGNPGIGGNVGPGGMNV